MVHRGVGRPVVGLQLLPVLELVDDVGWVAVLLRVREESIRYDCQQVSGVIGYSTRILRVPTPCLAMESCLARP